MNAIRDPLTIKELSSSSLSLDKIQKPVVQRDRLFAEDSPPFSKPQAIYHDPNWATVIQYHPYEPLNTNISHCYDSREGLIEDIVAERLEQRSPGDYSGFEEGCWQQLKGKVHRFAHGTTSYHQHLLQKSTNLRHANYSIKPLKNFNVQITPKQDLRSQLGLLNSQDDYKLWATSTWSNNGPNGLSFINEHGETEVVHHASVSSNDRTSEKVLMMRAIDDYQHTKESIAYTGRPDTKERAIEQITFMFKRELNKNACGKGLKKNGDVFEFTYMVNNLMTPLSPIGWFTFDEKASIDREAAILQELSQDTLMIDGHKVRVKPLFFNQSFNKGNYYGPNSSHNKKGYTELLDLAEHMQTPEEEQVLLQAAIKHLKNPELLLPEEQVFYRDLITKICKIPAVFHCKSSTDRTAIALSVSMALQQWRNTSQEFPNNPKGELAPHLLLQDPVFKELFAANSMHGHQVTRAARTAEGIVKGVVQNNRKLGLQWHGNPVALRLMPERYTKTAPNPGLLRSIGTCIPILKNHIAASFHPWFIGTLLSILNIAQTVFHSNWIAQKIDYLEKAFPNKTFNEDSMYMKDRSFLKPKGMTV